MNAPEIMTFLNEGHEIHVLEECSQKYFDCIFTLFDRIAEGDEDFRYAELWLKADRGTAEEAIKSNLICACLAGETEEQRQEAFNMLYPQEQYWFLLKLHEREGYRALSIGNLYITISKVLDESGEYIKYGQYEFFHWLCNEVVRCINELEEGVYMENLNRNLPLQYRTGVLLRKDFWRLNPSARADKLRDMTNDEIREVIRLLKEENHYRQEGIPRMTYGRYLDIVANIYEELNMKVNEENILELIRQQNPSNSSLYERVDFDSYGDFVRLVNGEWNTIGNPWAIFSGEKYEKLLLKPYVSKGGFALMIEGEWKYRVYEIIKIYLTLYRQHIPVYLSDSHFILDILEGKDYVGFIPLTSPLWMEEYEGGKYRYISEYHHIGSQREEVFQAMEMLPLKEVKIKKIRKKRRKEIAK